MFVIYSEKGLRQRKSTTDVRKASATKHRWVLSAVMEEMPAGGSGSPQHTEEKTSLC